MDKRFQKQPDRRPPEGGHSLGDWEKARKKNLKEGIWSCPCGSRTFHLVQQRDNVKAVCSECGDTEIIYWNGKETSGGMRRLDTNTWVYPQVKLNIR